MQKRLYTNLMVAKNQKTIIDIQRVRRKEYKYDIKGNQQTMKEKKSRMDQKKFQKQPQNKK